MQAHARCHAGEDIDASALNGADLQGALAALRQEFRAVASDMRQVMRENEELTEEVARLKRQRRSTRRTSEVQRIRRECVDGLARLQELAYTTRSRRRPEAERPVAQERDRSDGAAWMKKMMMFMMIAELV